MCPSCGLEKELSCPSLVVGVFKNVCQDCHEVEKACIERAGTNDLPQLRDLYSYEGKDIPFEFEEEENASP